MRPDCGSFRLFQPGGRSSDGCGALGGAKTPSSCRVHSDVMKLGMLCFAECCESGGSPAGFICLHQIELVYGIHKYRTPFESHSRKGQVATSFVRRGEAKLCQRAGPVCVRRNSGLRTLCYDASETLFHHCSRWVGRYTPLQRRRCGSRFDSLAISSAQGPRRARFLAK
jgi:hypothetical protein